MAKPKQHKRKYTPVRTDVRKSSQKNKIKKGIGAAVLAVASFLAHDAIGMISAPPYVGVLLLGFTATCGWFGLIQLSRIPFLGRRYIHYPAYAIILVVFLPCAWHVYNSKPSVSEEVTSSPVTTSVEDSPESRVAAVGEAHGPVTIDQSVADKRTIINVYNSIPPDEKQQWRQYLSKKYPLGWTLLATDGKEVYTPNDMSYQDYVTVRWGAEGIVRLTAEKVYLQLPDIKLGGIAIHGGVKSVMERRVGSVKHIVGTPQVRIEAELLKDEGDFVVVAIGFQKPE